MAKIDNFEIDTIYNEDCLATMKRMPDNFVDLVVTSPPYDNLREYNGYSFDFESIAKELYRTTKQGGVVVWIVNDATINGSETGTSFKQALYFKEIGFNLHDTMIWQKDAIPYDPKCFRYWQGFEYMFVLSKGKPKTCNYIKVPSLNAGQKKKNDYGQKRTDGTTRTDRWNSNRTIQTEKVMDNVWYFSSDNTNYGHPAVFPQKLVSSHIVSWSNEGDLVYDCFLGSGTTVLMAQKYKRHFVGSEISEEYFKIASNRVKLEQAQLSLF